MKVLKTFKSLALFLVLAFAGGAFAEIIVPTTSSLNFVIDGTTTVEQWNQFNTTLKNTNSSIENIIVKVTDDVDLGGTELTPLSLQGKNLYLIGKTDASSSKKVTVSGISQQKALFKKLGKKVAIKDIVFKNVEYNVEIQDTVPRGFLFDKVELDSLLVESLEMDSIKVNLKPATPDDDISIDRFGILAGSVIGNVKISGLILTNCDIDTAQVSNAGSLIGAVKGNVNLENVQVSGKMNVWEYENPIYKDGLSVGGVIGSVSGGVLLNNVKSGMEIVANIEDCSYNDFTRNVINAKIGIGGFVGKMDGGNSGANTFNILNSEFSGGISSVSKGTYEMGVGGIVGLAQNYPNGINVGNVNVDSKSVISHIGTNAYIGGVIGAVVDDKVFDISLVKVAKQLLLSNSSSAVAMEASAMGGLIGASENTNIVARKNTVSSFLNLMSAGSTSITDSLYVGGAIGCFWNDLTPKRMLLEDVSFENKIQINYRKGKASIFAGGLMGQALNFDTLTVSKSFVKSSSGSTFDISLQDNAADEFFVGGLVGFTKGVAVRIDAASVQGNAKYTLDNKNRAPSYISGFIGYADDEDVAVENFIYEGDVAFAKDTVYDYLTGSGILSGIAVPEENHVSLSDGYVVCEKATAFTNNDAKIDSARIFLNEKYMVDFLPSDLYLLSHDAGAWYFDQKRAKLVSFCENADSCQVLNKVTFVNLKGNGFDVDVYSDKNGAWTLKADGSSIGESDLPVAGPVFNSNGDSMSVWKDANGVPWTGAANLVDGQVFSLHKVGTAVVVYKIDVTQSGKKIELLVNPDFDFVKDSVLPVYIFEDGDSNGSVKYSMSSAWGVLNENVVFTDVQSVKNYVAQKTETDTVTLVAAGGSNGASVQDFRRYIELVNAVVMFRVKTLGINDTFNLSSNGRYFPKMTELEIVGSATGSGCFQMYVNNVLLDTIEMNYTIDMTQYADSDAIKFFGTNCPEPESSSSSSENPNSSSEEPGPSSGGSSGGPDYSSSSSSADNTLACIAASKISNVEFHKSGKSAALFKFKFNIPDTCGALTPSASVRGPEGLLWYSPFASTTKSYEFTYYPLEPGTYKFNVKLAEGKDTTFMKAFKADMSVNGHQWNLAAIGTWPKGTVKNGEADVFEWSQDVLIGDYWQYQALPNIQDVVEDVGYWIYAEKNLEFSLDLPLKKAESDSISWDLKRGVNGWNLLANPYSWDLEATSVKNFMDPESDESPFWRLNSDGAFEVASVLGANEAFWISTDKNRTIKVSTKPMFATAKDSKESSKKSLKKANPGSWSMALVAKSENGTSDSWNVLGVGSRNIALEEPPAGMNETVKVSFEGEGDKKLAKRILAKSENEYSWNVNLKASEAGKVELSLEGLDEIRAMGYKAILVVDGETAEFGSDASVSVDVSTKSKKALLKVVPACAKVVAVSGISDVRYSVSAGRMDVQFSVPFAMAGRTASVNLMDVNGKVVARAQGKANAGSNALQIASPVRNGVYVLQVRVGNDSRVVRLAL